MSSVLVVILHHVADERQQSLVGLVFWDDSSNVAQDGSQVAANQGGRVLSECNYEGQQDVKFVWRNEFDKFSQRLDCLNLNIVLNILEESVEDLNQTEICDLLAKTLGNFCEILTQSQSNSPALIFCGLNNDG